MNHSTARFFFRKNLSRRALLRQSLVGTASWALLNRLLLVGVPRPTRAATAEVPETEDNIEGPFYKPGAPMDSVLRKKGMRGTPLRVAGRVFDTHGHPLRGALLDVWQANDEGVYDNTQFTLRGRILTDDSGGYELITIKPRAYGSDGEFRPSHIHVKVSAPGCDLLTTQLYFKGDPYNAIDPWVRPSLILAPRSGSDGLDARFDFVLKDS